MRQKEKEAIWREKLPTGGRKMRRRWGATYLDGALQKSAQHLDLKKEKCAKIS
ncbi:hypothetical protein ACUUL3_07765 [Thiovibrio sp. JS02]